LYQEKSGNLAHVRRPFSEIASHGHEFAQTFSHGVKIQNVQIRAARFLLVQHTKTGKYTKGSLHKYAKESLNIPK
jgi:hypothetical protein